MAGNECHNTHPSTIRLEDRRRQHTEHKTASWDGGIDGGNAAWTISGEGNAGYGCAAFLSSIGECGVCCDGMKLGGGADGILIYS